MKLIRDTADNNKANRNSKDTKLWAQTNQDSISSMAIINYTTLNKLSGLRLSFLICDMERLIAQIRDSI